MLKRLFVFLLLVAAMVGGMYLLRNVGAPKPEPAAIEEEQPAAVDTMQALPEPAVVDTAAVDTLGQF